MFTYYFNNEFIFISLLCILYVYDDERCKMNFPVRDNTVLLYSLHNGYMSAMFSPQRLHVCHVLSTTVTCLPRSLRSGYMSATFSPQTTVTCLPRSLHNRYMSATFSSQPLHVCYVLSTAVICLPRRVLPFKYHILETPLN